MQRSPLAPAMPSAEEASTLISASDCEGQPPTPAFSECVDWCGEMWRQLAGAGYLESGLTGSLR